MKCNFTNDTSLLVLYQELAREVEKLKNDTNSRLLLQNGKISEFYVYIKNHLSKAIQDLFVNMENSGELTKLITNVVLLDIMDSIEKTNVFYDGITTDKLYDSTSKTYYYLTKIPYKDENGNEIKIKMGIANDDPNFTSLEGTLKHAWRKNATACINCGVFNVDTGKPVASVIYEGKIIYRDIPTVTPEKYQYLAITKDNKLKVYPIGTTPEAMIRDDVYYACAIFASLIIEGAPVTQTDDRKEPRQSIGVTATGDIIFVSCDGRSFESAGMTYDDLARIHALNGSVNAWICDGGGSTSTVLRGVKQNENVDGFTTDRSVGTFIFVAKDTNVSAENNSGNDLGKVKQFLIGQIRSKVNFPQGYIRLMGQENFLGPGVELYVDGETTRRSKWGISFDKTNQRNTYIYFGLKGPTDEKEITNLLRIYPHGVWVQTYHGPSGSRPSGIIGLQYFDETLGKPIWYNGTKWVDSTGTAV